MDGQADSRGGRDGSASGDTVSGIIARPLDQRRAQYAERAAAEADQDAADADQTASDADETASERDAADAERDQRASDQDQASADRQQPADADAATQTAYEIARAAREASTISRLATHADRATTARARAERGAERDATATRRDETARRRDLRAEVIERSIAASDAPLAEQLERLRARAAADRARAADDRARAARDRAAAARERVRLEAELRSAHLDDLTGAFRREAGELALTHEIERARRGDGRFVVAFVDVDGMKRVNDRDGHAAGDRVLQSLVWTMRSQLRSYDPIVRFGGDEFVVGLGGVDLGEVERRFAAIDRLVRHDVGVGVSVGLATLGGDETLDQLTAMADAALLHAKKRRGAARVRRANDASGVTAPAARNGPPSPMVVSQGLCTRFRRHRSILSSTTRLRRRGQSLVEFALVLPIFVLVLLGILDFGFLLSDRMTVINAANEGAQYGSTLSSANWPNMQADVTTQVDSVVAGLTTSNLTINVTCWVPNTSNSPATWTLCSGCTTTSCSSWPTTGLQGDAVQVSVTYPYQPFFPLFHGTTINFSSSVQMVIYPRSSSG